MVFRARVRDVGRTHGGILETDAITSAPVCEHVVNATESLAPTGRGGRGAGRGQDEDHSARPEAPHGATQAARAREEGTRNEEIGFFSSSYDAAREKHSQAIVAKADKKKSEKAAKKAGGGAAAPAPAAAAPAQAAQEGEVKISRSRGASVFLSQERARASEISRLVRRRARVALSDTECLSTGFVRELLG